MEMSDRAREARKALKKTQKDFAKLLGIGQSTLAMMEISNGPIADRYIKIICSICNVNEHWLRTGEGQMFNNDKETVIRQLQQELFLTDDEMDLLSVYLEFPSEERQQILAFAKRYSEKLAEKAMRRPLTIDEKVAAYRAELEAEEREKAKSSASPNGKENIQIA